MCRVGHVMRPPVGDVVSKQGPLQRAKDFFCKPLKHKSRVERAFVVPSAWN